MNDPYHISVVVTGQQIYGYIIFHSHKLFDSDVYLLLTALKFSGTCLITVRHG